jgi:hypothetical protein
MKSAQLPRQTTLTTNQKLPAARPKSIREIRGGLASGWRLKDANFLYCVADTTLEASAMMNAKATGPAPHPEAETSAPGRDLPPAALRALKEAAARRAEAKPAAPRELNGRSGPDPVRYGDWEVKGLASDF